MHYADGTPAKAGDLVVKRIPEGQFKGTELIGFLRSGNASYSSCNGNIDVIAVRDVSDLGTTDWRAVNYTGWSITVGEFLPLSIPALPAKAA